MKTLSLYLSTAADVNEVAETIAKCDFRTAMSRYTTGNDSPWVITVVLETFDGDAKLGLLTKEQSERRITDIDTSAIERTMTLGELTAFSYSGIRKLLTAELAAA
jgi:hypothetical protein